MKTYLITLLSILVVELTDRTRFIAFLLSARYRTPFQLIAGMTLGYVPATALAVLASGVITQFISPTVLRWIVAASFLGFGIYLLLPRQDGEEENAEKKLLGKFEHLAPFWIGFILVTLTEFADKSQLATAGLALKYKKPWAVFAGSISAQALLNIIYVGFGSYLGERIPMRFIRWIAAATFIIFGILTIVV